MPYITHADLADSPGALELSQVASDEHRPPVRAELLDVYCAAVILPTGLPRTWRTRSALSAASTRPCVMRAP